MGKKKGWVGGGRDKRTSGGGAGHRRHRKNQWECLTSPLWEKKTEPIKLSAQQQKKKRQKGELRQRGPTEKNNAQNPQSLKGDPVEREPEAGNLENEDGDHKTDSL